MNRIGVEEEICFLSLDNKPNNSIEKPEFVNARELDAVIKSSNCKAIIISGEGRHFSSGANLEQLKEMVLNQTLNSEIEKGKALLDQLTNYNLPIISCIEGACLGGGLEIALIADIKIASKKAVFAFPETNLNLIPGLAGISRLEGITGGAKSLELVLKGDIIDAQTALDLNIVDALVDAKTTLLEGKKMAHKMIKQKSLEVIKAVVASVRNAKKMTFNEAMVCETEFFCNLAREAVKNNQV